MTAEGSLEDLARRVAEVEEALLHLQPLARLVDQIAQQPAWAVATVLEAVARAGVIVMQDPRPPPGYG